MTVVGLSRVLFILIFVCSFGGVQHETVNSKRLRAILNSVFIATQLGSFDSKLGCVAVPPQCDSSTWNSALQSTMRWRELHVTHAILTLTGKVFLHPDNQTVLLFRDVVHVVIVVVEPTQNRLYCTPPGVMPVKNSLLTMLEAEVNAGQLTSQSNNTRYNVRPLIPVSLCHRLCVTCCVCDGALVTPVVQA